MATRTNNTQTLIALAQDTNAKIDTLTQSVAELVGVLKTQAFAQPAPAPKKGQGKNKPTVEKIVYTKADGTTVMATPAQAKQWDAFKASAPDRKERAAKFEAMKTEWEDTRKAYKPSKKLLDAIKANPAAVTLAVAKTMGFVGTKQDLYALKYGK